jgi:tetratricopeptide (TPR) repeat protein
MALAIDPDNVDALNNKGNALASSVGQIESTTYYGTTPHPNSPTLIYVKAANSLTPTSDLGNFQPAIDNYDKGLATDPNNIELLANKGQTLFKATKYDEAIQVLDKGLVVDPNDVSCNYYKGLSLEKLGRISEANEYKDKVAQIDPTYGGDYVDADILLTEFGGNAA